MSSLIFGQLKSHQQAIDELQKALALLNEKIAVLLEPKAEVKPPEKRKPGRPRKK